MNLRQRAPEKVWEEFCQLIQPSKEQLHQFEKYAAYLLECNELFNLTAISDLSGVVRYHFLDSLALGKFTDMSTIKVIADIGTGAGFPAIPLKIMYPHLKIILIEVTKKKQEFLSDICKILALDDVTICDMDWRTFLRHSTDPVDTFITRAALADLELIRMFRPACVYKNSTLIYWVSKDWEPHKRVAPYIVKRDVYKIGNRESHLAFLKLPVTEIGDKSE